MTSMKSIIRLLISALGICRLIFAEPTGILSYRVSRLFKTWDIDKAVSDRD